MSNETRSDLFAPTCQDWEDAKASTVPEAVKPALAEFYRFWDMTEGIDINSAPHTLIMESLKAFGDKALIEAWN